MEAAFNGLQVERDLLRNFFAVFARFEFAMKEGGYIRTGSAHPDPAWHRYADEAATRLVIEDGSPLESAITYLRDDPPWVQTGARLWEPRPLRGSLPLVNALDAVQRVRNNLFHGGKHTPHSAPGRDQRLVENALSVLLACVQGDEVIRTGFTQPGW